MIFVPLFELAFFILNIVLAIMNRGTMWGWICTAIVIWQVYNAVKIIKEI